MSQVPEANKKNKTFKFITMALQPSACYKYPPPLHRHLHNLYRAYPEKIILFPNYYCFVTNNLRLSVSRVARTPVSYNYLLNYLINYFLLLKFLDSVPSFHFS